MNHQNSLAAFSRMAKLVVSRQLKATRQTNSYDYVGQLINNMQVVNVSLMASAIRLIKKVKENAEIDMERFTQELREIISNSVTECAKAA